MEADAIRMFQQLRLIYNVPQSFDNNEDQVKFLSRKLRDGKLLCELLDVLIPRCFVKNGIRFHKSEQALRHSEYQCSENINWFLEILNKEFKISEKFPVSAVYDCTDIYSVLKVLAKISQHETTHNKEITPFFCDDDCDLEIYDSMSPIIQHNLDSNVPLSPNGYWAQDTRYDDDTDAIYGMLVGTNDAGEGDEVHYDDDLMMPVTPSSGYHNEAEENENENFGDAIYHLPNQKKRERDWIIKEIVDTEWKYIKNLKAIIDHFKTPLSQGLLSPLEIRKIFLNIEDLYATHLDFHEKLKLTMEQRFETRKISVPFKVKKDKFSHYAEYLLGIDDSEALLEKVLSSNDRVAAVIDAGVEKATEHKFKLIELIKLPMQRILRYPLIVERLMKASGKEHTDYKELTTVLEDLVDLNQYINQTKADMQQTIKPMMEFQAIINASKMNVSMVPSTSVLGRFLADQNVLKWSDNDRVTYKPSQCSAIRVMVFNTHFMAMQISITKRHIEKIIWLKPIDMVQVSDVKVKQGVLNTLFGRQEYQLSVLSKNHGHSPQTLTFKDEKKANLLRQSILDAKEALLAGRDRDGIIIYRLADVPKLEGVLPQCCRINCRKLFHGIKMQGYQSVANNRIFVHRKCLEAIINQGEEVEAPPDVPVRNPSRKASGVSPRKMSRDGPGTIRPHTVFVDDPVKPKIPQRSATLDTKTMNSPKIPPRVHSQRSFDDVNARPQLRQQNSIPEVHENPTFQDEDSFESDSNDSILNRPVAPPPLPSLDRGRTRPVPIPRLAQTNNRRSSSPLFGNVYTLEPTDFRNLNVNGNSDSIYTKEYYDESIGRDAASRILSQHGSKHSFLIRARNAAGDVLTAPYALSIRVESGRVHHARVYCDQSSKKYYLATRNQFGSVDEMIKYYQRPDNDLNTAFPDLRGPLGNSVYVARGRVNNALHNQKCHVIRAWSQTGNVFFYSRVSQGWTITETSGPWIVKMSCPEHNIEQFPRVSDVTYA